MNRHWTQEDEDLLDDLWSSPKSVKAIARRLGRTEGAVSRKAIKLGLGPKLDAGEWVSARNLYAAVTGNIKKSYGRSCFIFLRDFPRKKVTIGKKHFFVVYLSDWWKWAEKNKESISFAKFEPLALGVEPDWVAKKRHDDFAEKQMTSRGKPWTKMDDVRLEHMVTEGKDINYVCRELKRSEMMVKARCYILGLDRPINPVAHHPWSRHQHILLRELILEGKPWTLIAQSVGKGEQSCRSRAFNCWGSSNIDKLRTGLVQAGGDFDRLLSIAK